MKTNLKQTIIATLIIIGMAGVAYATITTSADFPHRLSGFVDNDIINAGDWGNIESDLGTHIGNVATGTPQTLNWIVRNASFASTTLTVGLTASTTISGDTGTSTFVNGITLNAGCFKVAGSCLTSSVGNPNLIYSLIGATKYYTASSTATNNLTYSFKNGIITNASSTITTLNVGSCVGCFTDIPNLTINTIGATKFIGASTTALAWSIPQGFVSNASSTIITPVMNVYKGFTIASTTLLTGTTTLPLPTTIVKETMNQVVCYTDVGTLDIIFYNSLNPINLGTGITTLHVTTASSTTSFTAGNALPALTKRKIDVGNVATAPNYVSCLIDSTQNQ